MPTKKNAAAPKRAPSDPADELAEDAANLMASAAAAVARGQVAAALRASKQWVHACERGAARGLAPDKLNAGVDVLDRVFRIGDADQRAQARALLERLEAVRLSLLR